MKKVFFFIFLLLSIYETIEAQGAVSGCSDSLVLQNVQLPQGYFFNNVTRKILRNGNSLLVAQTSDYLSNSSAIIQLDADGNFKQAFEYRSKQTSDKMLFYSIDEGINGDILLSGVIKTGNKLKEPVVLKLSPQLAVIWCKTIHDKQHVTNKIMPPRISTDHRGDIYLAALEYTENIPDSYKNLFSPSLLLEIFVGAVVLKLIMIIVIIITV